MLLSLPVIVKILTVLTLILVFNRVIRNLTLSLAAGTVLLALWTGQDLANSLRIVGGRVLDLNTLFLLLTIFSIIWLSSQMKETRIMESLVTAIRSRVSRKTSMALLPAVIGLLPMPGGAIFSAPLVDSLDENRDIQPLLKTQINYWFRHIWEYWWPLYPGILLAIEISGVPIPTFMLILFPVTFISLGAGYLFLLRHVHEEGEKPVHDSQALMKIADALLPIIITMGINTLLTLLFPALAALSRYIPMLFGVFTALIVTQLRRPLSLKQWKRILINPKTFNLVLLVLIIRIYGAFIEARTPEGLFLMDLMREELSIMGIPTLLLILFIPFLSGLTTGIAIGTVGASFPIVMSLIGPNPGQPLLLSTVVLAYVFGYMGMMLSPVHVCLIVTNEYFKTSMPRSLAGLLKPAILVLTGGALVSRIVYALF